MYEKSRTTAVPPQIAQKEGFKGNMKINLYDINRCEIVFRKYLL